jgi:hypothetical protein
VNADIKTAATPCNRISEARIKSAPSLATHSQHKWFQSRRCTQLLHATKPLQHCNMAARTTTKSNGYLSSCCNTSTTSRGGFRPSLVVLQLCPNPIEGNAATLSFGQPSSERPVSRPQTRQHQLFLFARILRLLCDSLSTLGCTTELRFLGGLGGFCRHLKAQDYALFHGPHRPYKAITKN